MKRWLLILLVLSLLLSAGCAAQKAPAGTPQEPVPEYDPNRPIETCYTNTKNENGTYSYQVIARNDAVLLEGQGVPYPVVITPINEHVLSLSGQDGPRLSDRWAVFCDVQNAVVYERIRNVVAVGNNQIAFVEKRSGQYHLFVCSAIDSTDIRLGEPLTGIAVLEGEEPDIKTTYKNSKLTVTYSTKDGDKTVTCELL